MLSPDIIELNVKTAVSACCYDNNPENTSCSENIGASLIY